MPFRRSLAPSLFGRHRDKVDWWDAWEYPPRIFDQKFGVDLRDEDLFDREPFFRRRLGAVSPRRTQVCDVRFSERALKLLRFEVRLDVSHFKPSEITVKLVGTDAVVVHGRHDERQDEHGFVSREFTRRYMLPPDVNIDDVVSEFVAEADGVLVVRAAKKSPEPAAVQRARRSHRRSVHDQQK
ncbi:crystallin, alpha B, putative, partial [Ixodes scapularis]